MSMSVVKGAEKVRVKYFDGKAITPSTQVLEDFIASIGGETKLIDIVMSGQQAVNILVIYRG